jgi:hypothetical protein
MTRKLAILFLSMAILAGGCATSKKQERSWQAGDTVICPHCGRSFQVPEKLGQ